MVTSTLPLAAAVYSGDGHTWYPARPAGRAPASPGDVMWFPVPEIPDGVPFCWATLAEADVHGLDLGDTSTLTVLLCLSTLDPSWELPITPEMLRVAVLAQADRFGCRLDAALAQIADASCPSGWQACAERTAWCAKLARTMVVSQ